MPVSQEELMFLQSQLEGLESIFLELVPFGVELKRQQVQDYYEKRFDQATKPHANVAETELKRQFNTKANNVRNLVDSAESLGDAGNKLNLIRAAATLPDERSRPLKGNVGTLCHGLLYENSIDQEIFNGITSTQEIGHVEARVLLGSVMFLIVDELKLGSGTMATRELLQQLIKLAQGRGLLAKNDPFLIEANCALEAMSEEHN
ncbi:MAG: hypothetical protein U0105_06210 [Candidatus Obscuribacterales bacterium]